MGERMPALNTTTQAVVYKTFQLSDFNEGNLENLERGGEGTCCKAKVEPYGEIVLKVFHRPILPSLNDKNTAYSQNTKEIETLLKFHYHPNIIRIFGLVESDQNLPLKQLPYICGYAMEYMECGSLYHLIMSQATYNESDAYNWIKQAARGLQYLHEHHIIHRDVKPHNMLLSKGNKELKISDFGCCKSIDTTCITAQKGTWYYMAPEFFTFDANGKQRLGVAVDVYALAITIWEIFHRKRPYTVSNQAMSFGVIRGERPPIKINLNSSVRDIIERSWHQDPKNRCKVMEIILFAEAQLSNITKTKTAPKSNSDDAKKISSITEPIRKIPQEKDQIISRAPQMLPPKLVVNIPQFQGNKATGGSSAPLPPSPGPRTIRQTRSMNDTTSTIDTYDTYFSKLQVFFFSQTAENFYKIIRGIKTFFRDCQDDIKSKNSSIFTYSTALRYFAIGPEGILPHPEYVVQQNRYPIQQKNCQDIGCFPDLFRRIIVYYFNPNIGSIETLTKINHCYSTIERFEKIYSRMGTRLSSAITIPEFICLIVGNARIDSKQFVLDIQNTSNPQGNPIQLYKMNYFHTNIPNDRQLTTSADLILNQIYKLGIVHSICFLVDANVEYGTFGEPWNSFGKEYSIFCLICDKNERMEEQKFKSKFLPDVPADTITVLRGTDSASHFTKNPKMYDVFYRMYVKCIANLVNNTKALEPPKDWNSEPTYNFR